MNKMESPIHHIRDTRERIEIKHLKFSDIAQREFDKIMPNDLTQTFSKTPKAVSSHFGRKAKVGIPDEVDDDALSSME